jgi:hypothetical protein
VHINKIHFSLSKRRSEFISAKPFPHIVLEEFLTIDTFKNVTDELNQKKILLGKSFDSYVETNKSISLNSTLPNTLVDIIGELNSVEWVNNLRELTGISDLSGTKNDNSMLANYHVMKGNGILGSHVDHASEPLENRAHVLNIIVYLSDKWSKNKGGDTQLYDKSGQKILRKVKYKTNRALIFLHTPYSFHGVSRLRNPSKDLRKSLYVDYYSASLSPYSHFNLEFPNLWFNHKTTFKLKRGIEYLRPINFNYLRNLIEYSFNRKIAEIKNFLGM